MKQFLIVYDRQSGRQVDLKPFDSRQAAMKARFERELLERGNLQTEVVVLSASSLENLQRTHARYFKSIGQLATG